MPPASVWDPRDALRQLAADDLIALDGRDTLVAAYPFSPTPTAHVVSRGDVRAFEMCAIDALGIPFMLDRDAPPAVGGLLRSHHPLGPLDAFLDRVTWPRMARQAARVEDGSGIPDPLLANS